MGGSPKYGSVRGSEEAQEYAQENDDYDESLKILCDNYWEIFKTLREGFS